MSNRARKADGSTASLSRDAWECMASEHHATADSLLWLVGRSFDVLLGKPLDETTPATYALRKLAILRARQEGVDDATEWLPELTTEERELRCLLHTMLRWAFHERERAQTYRGISEQSRMGRPRKRPAYNELARMTAAPVKRGRPPLVNISEAELLARVKAGTGEGRTQRETLRALVKDVLKSSSQHAAGNRVPRMVSSLEKRLAPSSRARLRKSRV